MDFYASIASYYELIFPTDPMVASFTDVRVPREQPRSLLDVGCATGGLVEALSPLFQTVHGIDLDAGLIKTGRDRRWNQGQPNVQYQVMSMLAVAEVFVGISFSGISCFGNTLAHLADLQEVLGFFTACRKILKAGGSLLVQIINYDRILDQGISELPPIDNPAIRFERNYSQAGDDGRLQFNTRLIDKAENIVLQNSVPLLPVRASTMISLLSEAGFEQNRLYGNFQAHSWTPQSFLTIIDAR